MIWMLRCFRLFNCIHNGWNISFFSLFLSASALKKFRRIKQRIPLPLLFNGISSLLDIVIPLNTLSYLGSGITGFNSLAISGFISLGFSIVRLAISIVASFTSRFISFNFSCNSSFSLWQCRLTVCRYMKFAKGKFERSEAEPYTCC